MSDTEQILLIILSAALAFFLIIGIVVLLKLIEIFNQLKIILQKAETVADRVDHIGTFFEKTTATLAIGRLLANISEAVKGRPNKRRRKHSDE